MPRQGLRVHDCKETQKENLTEDNIRGQKSCDVLNLLLGQAPKITEQCAICDDAQDGFFTQCELAHDIQDLRAQERNDQRERIVLGNLLCNQRGNLDSEKIEDL